MNIYMNSIKFFKKGSKNEEEIPSIRFHSNQISIKFQKQSCLEKEAQGIYMHFRMVNKKVNQIKIVSI